MGLMKKAGMVALRVLSYLFKITIMRIVSRALTDVYSSSISDAYHPFYNMTQKISQYMYLSHEEPIFPLGSFLLQRKCIFGSVVHG